MENSEIAQGSFSRSPTSLMELFEQPVMMVKSASGQTSRTLLDLTVLQSDIPFKQGTLNIRSKI